MNRVKNIAKLVILLTTILLLAGNRYAHAQNSPELPYYRSWHKYKVENVVSPNYEWHIFKTEDDANNFENGTELTNSLSYVEGVGLNLGVATIEIYFDEDVFTDPSVFLVFSEYSEETGACTARRKFNINIATNEFYFTLPTDNPSVCNSLDGRVLDGDDVTSYVEMESYVEFTFSMHKSDQHLVDNWEVEGDISIANTTSYGITDVYFSPLNGTSLTRNENWDLTDNGNGNFLLELDCDPDDADYTEDNVTIRAYILGEVTESLDITLELSNGKAYSGSESGYVVVTDDNGSGDDNQTITINPLPATSNITITD